MKDIVIAVIILAVLAVAIAYIVKAKKSGVKCIGCPMSKECNKCSCGCTENEYN